MSPRMQTTKGLGHGALRYMQAWVFLSLLAACSKQNTPSAPEQASTRKKSDALQQWRDSRALARMKAEAEKPAEAAPKTNAIDSAKALKAINSFPDRLKKIVGNPLENSQSIRAKAEKGDAAAQAELASTYWNEGDFASALNWYQKAAAQGNVRAEHALGVMHVFGQGVNVDYAEAVKWFTKAAEKGDIDSQYSLGVRYVKGDHVEQNFAEAVKWFTMAANQGQPDSQVSLGRRYMNGEGVQKDVVEAYKWFLVAGDYWSAAGIRDELARSLTPEQIAEAQKRADAFKPQKTITK